MIAKNLKRENAHNFSHEFFCKSSNHTYFLFKARGHFESCIYLFTPINIYCLCNHQFPAFSQIHVLFFLRKNYRKDLIFSCCTPMKHQDIIGQFMPSLHPILLAYNLLQLTTNDLVYDKEENLPLNGFENHFIL